MSENIEITTAIVSEITSKTYGYDLGVNKNENICKAINKVLKGEKIDRITLEKIICHLFDKSFFREDISRFNKIIGTMANLILIVKEYLSNEENIVKKTCKELGITQKELAEKFGLTASAISQWDNEVPKTAQIALELMIENNQLKKDLKYIIEGQKTLNRLTAKNLDN
jgi:DNA-binding XRE family transcriptional regulator